MGGVQLNNNYDTYGLTPLHVAAQQGHNNIIRILIHHGAWLNARDLHNNNSPLHTAFLHDMDGAGIIIMGAGASSEAFNKEGFTPMMILAGRAKVNTSANEICNTTLSVGAMGVKSKKILLPESFQQLVHNPGLILPGIGLSSQQVLTTAGPDPQLMQTRV